MDDFDLIIKRKSDNEWYFLECPSEVLTRRDMMRILYAFHISPEELACMRLEFEMFPDKDTAYFGINGTFLYCK